MRIGVAGVGRMGGAIASRLMDLGHQMTVWNRTSDKCIPLAAAGARIAASPAALAQQVEIVITILTDQDALAAVYEGANGLLSANVMGKLFLEMSTVAPETEVALAEKVRASGGTFVECPVGGTVGPAREGKLLGVAGGAAADVAVARPLLGELCRRVEHVGPVGAGASIKLALNLPLMIYYQALGESYVLCRHLGLDPSWLIELLSDTSGAPNILKVRGPKIATALAGGDAGPVAFDVASIGKDLTTMVAEARTRGATLPLTEKTLAIVEEAAKDGWGNRDGASLPAYWPWRNPEGKRQ